MKERKITFVHVHKFCPDVLVHPFVLKISDAVERQTTSPSHLDTTPASHACISEQSDPVGSNTEN